MTAPTDEWGDPDEWVPGRVHRTNDWLYRYSAYIDTGDVSTRWNAKTWTLWGLRVRAGFAERRLGVRVDWRARLPRRHRQWWQSRPVIVLPDPAGLPAQPGQADVNDTVILPVEDPR